MDMLKRTGYVIIAPIGEANGTPLLDRQSKSPIMCKLDKEAAPAQPWTFLAWLANGRDCLLAPAI